MKKLITIVSFLTLTIAANAIPAKPGLWQTITLADGTQVRARLVGDEHAHFWMAEDGRRFVSDGTAYVQTTEQALRGRALARRAKASKAPRRKVEFGERTSYTGKKKGLVILVQYKDVKFKSSNTLEKYKQILNGENYKSSEGFVGSVADYFKAQSHGQFELEFDVVGPVTLKYNRSHYGKNDYYDNDVAPEEMVVEGCNAIKDQVNFSDYDWDGDGLVDQVFVLYAGTGEADSYDTNAVWPHMWYLSETDAGALEIDGVTIDTYACSNEVTSSGAIEGIGCFCHEFSHCLGYPDLYDIIYSGNFGMSQFDLMDAGAYNGDTFRPAGYSAYERWMAGWIELTELADEDVQVNNLQPMSEEGGQAYIMYNSGHPDEYYVIENRQKTNWDAGLPGKGLMVTHVDFDKRIWEENIPNTTLSASEAAEYGVSVTNDHQRLTIFHADNDDDSKYWQSYGQYYTKQTLSTDLYPYNKRDSLTATSKPAATLYNANAEGKKMMNGALIGIKQNTDRTMSFTYRAKTQTGQGGQQGENEQPSDGDMFYESFDKCSGKGGNDGVWNTNIFSSTFAPDNDGWNSEKPFAGAQCARFGTNKVQGIVTTPTMTVNGEAKLTFNAATWPKDGENLEIAVNTSGNVTISPTTFTVPAEQWTECELTVSGKGSFTLTYTPAKRFILDEVRLRQDVSTAISDAKRAETTRTRVVYDLQGRRVQPAMMGKGIYVIDGKKVVMK